MGLGKTVQALAWLQLHPELRPAMIVTPASLKLFWESMIHEWLPPCRTKVLYGIRPYSTAFKNIVIINYDILQGWKQALHDVSPKVLILDESHYIMHDKAKRTKATKTLSRGVQHIIALSGTPFLNRPIEIYNTISLINPDLFSDRWHFAERYCDLRHNGWGWDFSGASNKLELYQLLTSSIMIRRRKADVLDQLPPKTRAIIPIELDNEDEYREIEDDFLNWMTKHSGEAAARRASRAEHLVKEEKLKQAAIQGKIRRSMEWIQDYITSEGKLAIFVTHTSTVDILMERFKKVAIKMDGRDPTTIRKNIVDKFQGDPNILLFIGMIDVMGRPAGVGWTLTAATAVAFLELQWSPLTIEQAEDRVYGRLNDPHGAIIYFLLAPNSIEEKIIKMIDRKRKVIDSILDGEETTTGALLSEIIKEQKQRRSEHEN
jgi:SWI/SNF-related matrix-associated actin-dependent regulator 1 of chromatin subfamily A